MTEEYTRVFVDRLPERSLECPFSYSSKNDEGVFLCLCEDDDHMPCYVDYYHQPQACPHLRVLGRSEDEL